MKENMFKKKKFKKSYFLQKVFFHKKIKSIVFFYFTIYKQIFFEFCNFKDKNFFEFNKKINFMGFSFFLQISLFLCFHSLPIQYIDLEASFKQFT